MPDPRQQLKLGSARLLTPALLGLALVVAVVAALNTNPAYPSAGSAGTRAGAGRIYAVRTKPLPTRVASYLGVHEGDMPNSYALTETFKKAVGRAPNVVLYYSGWPENFRPSFANEARKHGAITLVDINPYGIPLPSISDGDQNAFIDEFADEVKAYGHPVMLSFGHEMNGTYYSWGSGHSTPAQFIAAWRHIVERFRADGADNVTWVWTVNAYASGIHSPVSWYPGNSYVNWIAMDGYIYEPDGSFQNTFGRTFKQIREVSKKPVFISETAVGPRANQAAKIPGLFKGVRQDHLLGFVWFDKTQNRGIQHQNWRLEDSARAVKTFRESLKKYFGPLAKP